MFARPIVLLRWWYLSLQSVETKVFVLKSSGPSITSHPPYLQHLEVAARGLDMNCSVHRPLGCMRFQAPILHQIQDREPTGESWPKSILWPSY